MASELQVIERHPNGHWISGQSGNPEGGRIVVGRKRVALAVETILATQDEGQAPDEVPQCITTIAETFVEGLKDPDAKPVAGRLAWERFWPTLSKGVHESARDAPPSSSADQWDAIALRAGVEVEAVADLAGAEPEPGSIEGAD